ncbi:HPr family phosphocarrier protein [Lichenihabitans sp. Uapishka_5]|nr:HPr family phosphocarrier protein [Lichenihabitans sp. Uapishka_5]MDX7950098.1 HPr family phosphocarrier protein [Lichenihabitans sp. Uapishka_5]
MMDEPEQPVSDAVTLDGRTSRTCLIVNRKGLHARATAKFVHCVEAYDADVQVQRGGETVGGMSIMGILTLGAGQGSTVTIAATGPQAMEVVEALSTLIANRFGEDE